jgi:hypothetical protein
MGRPGLVQREKTVKPISSVKSFSMRPATVTISGEGCFSLEGLRQPQSHQHQAGASVLLGNLPAHKKKRMTQAF